MVIKFATKTVQRKTAWTRVGAAVYESLAGEFDILLALVIWPVDVELNDEGVCGNYIMDDVRAATILHPLWSPRRQNVDNPRPPCGARSSGCTFHGQCWLTVLSIMTNLQ